MHEAEFLAYLKKKGKKDHVIRGLANSVHQFEDYLQTTKQKDMGSANQQDIDDYQKSLDLNRNNENRALALYFSMIGNGELAAYISDLRRQAITKETEPFRLRDFVGVDEDVIDKLREKGITTAPQMLEKGSTKAQRQELANTAGIDEDAIMELVKMSDLARIFGVKGIRARLYHDAGVDSVQKMVKREPEELLHYLQEWVKRTGFKGIAPLPKEIIFTIEAAKKLPKIVND